MGVVGNQAEFDSRMNRWPSQQRLLRAVADLPRATCGELAQASGLGDAGNALRSLQRLEQAGLVVRDPDPGGARWILSATAALWLGRQPEGNGPSAVVRAQRLALIARRGVRALAAALLDDELRAQVEWVSEIEHPELGALVGLRGAVLPSDAARTVEALRARGVDVQDVLLHEPRIGEEQMQRWARRAAGSEGPPRFQIRPNPGR